MSLHPNHTRTYLQAPDRKSPLSVSEEDFLKRVRQSQQYNVRAPSMGNVLQRNLPNDKHVLKKNTMQPVPGQTNKNKVAKRKNAQVHSIEKSQSELPYIVTTDEERKQDNKYEEDQQWKAHSVNNIGLNERRISGKRNQSEQEEFRSMPKTKQSMPQLIVKVDESQNEFMP